MLLLSLLNFIFSKHRHAGLHIIAKATNHMIFTARHGSSLARLTQKVVHWNRYEINVRGI